MTRQLSGLSMPRQLYWAAQYRRFGGTVHLGACPADPVCITGLPALSVLDADTRAALAELDAAVYAEWMQRPDRP